MSVRRSITLAMLAVFVTTGLYAGVSKKMAEWGKGPASFLMTKEDSEAWKSLKSDEEAQKFIDLFWARRDPTPATPENEYKALFEARVEYADKNFSFGRTKGSMSDRGKIAILLGLPSKAKRTGDTIGSDIIAPGATPTSLDPAAVEGAVASSGSVGSERVTRSEIWTYEQERVPRFSSQKTLTIPFIDVNSVNDYKLDRSPDTNVGELIRLAVADAIVSPGLAQVPVYAARQATPVAKVDATAVAPVLPDTSLKTEALKAAVSAYKAAAAAPYKDVYVAWGEYVTTTGEHFVPVQLYLTRPGTLAADQPVTIFGTIEDAAGKEVLSYEEPATTAVSKGSVYVDKSLTLAPGKYTGYFGLALDGQPVTLAKAPLDVKGVDKDASGVSQLLLSTDIFAMPKPQEKTTPYAFGGMKVVVKADQTFTRKDELWFFFEVRNPGLDAPVAAAAAPAAPAATAAEAPEAAAPVASGNPKMKMKIDVDGVVANNKKVKLGLPLADAQVEPLKGMPGHYAVGSTIPLETFQPGEYTMKIQLVDAVKNATYNLESKFRIVQ